MLSNLCGTFGVTNVQMFIPAQHTIDLTPKHVFQSPLAHVERKLEQLNLPPDVRFLVEQIIKNP